jgi:high-affinity Fe2+/Pb2+ permease
MKDATTDDGGLLRLIQFSSAFSLGLMAAFLYSVKQVTPELRCELSAGTGIAFIAGAVFSRVFFRIALKLEDSGARSIEAGGVFRRRVRRRSFLALSVVLSLATAGAFAFALRGVEDDKLMEIVQGTVIALFALAGVGALLWRVARFLEKDSKRNS